MAECEKLGKCGHCSCYSDIDHDLPGCLWCKILAENEELTNLVSTLSEERRSANLQIEELKLGVAELTERLGRANARYEAAKPHENPKR